jgi:CHRD domain
MRRIQHLVAVGAVAIGAIAIGDASPVQADHSFRAAAAVLRGANEVPPADPDGFGAAGVAIHVNRGTLCYFVTAARIQEATLAHIHRGARGVNGGIVVHLEAPSDGFSAECLTGLDRVLLGEIAHNPSEFYVNVHNAEFPGGAIRGQLR